MKIAAVNFYPAKSQVGGGQTPSVAFKEWCRILEYDCDLIGMSKDLPDDPLDRSEIRIFTYDQVDKLNDYDRIVFFTPPQPGFIDPSDFDPSYMMMIHAEFDVELYGGKDEIMKWYNSSKCLGLIHIDTEDKYFSEWHDHRYFWHPCCMPKDLMTKTSRIQGSTGNGGLYAARFSRWKNPELFMDVAQACMPGSIIKGYYTDPSRIEYLEKYASDNSRVTMFSQPFDDMGIDPSIGYFWDVSGSLEYQFEILRPNLVMFEGLKRGYMPIVNEFAIPSELRGLFIHINPIDPDMDHLFFQMERYQLTPLSAWDTINRKVSSSYAGYDSIQRNIQQILQGLQK